MARSLGSDKVQYALCKVEAQLPGGSGLSAVGSASLITINASDAAKRLGRRDVHEGKYLVTSDEALNREDITQLQCGNFSAEFLVEGQNSTQKFSFAKPGCVSEAEADCVPEGSLLFIPARKLADPRNRLKKVLWKSVLQCARPLQCSFQMADPNAEVAERLYCHVLCDSQLFYFRPYLMERETLDDSCGFYLKQFGSDTKVRFMDDFGKEDKPRGSAIVNQNGELVGVLSSSCEGEKRRIRPIWIAGAIEAITKMDENELLGSATGINSPTKASENTNGDLSKMPDENVVSVAINKSLTHSSPIDDTNPPKEISDPVVLGHDNNNDMANAPEVQPDDEPVDDPATHLEGRDRRLHSAVYTRDICTPTLPMRSYSMHSQCPINPDTLVNTHVIKNIYVMDALAQLDKVQSPGWQKFYVHLADHFKMPNDMLLRIQASSTNHPCERLFFYLTTLMPEISMGVIKGKLNAIGRKDIVERLNHISDDEKLCGMAHDLDFVYVSLETDGQPNWFDFGKSFDKVDLHKLEEIKITSPKVNPTESIIMKAYCNDASRTIGALKEMLKTDRPDVCNVLTLPDSATFNDLHNDLDVMKKVCFLLNREEREVFNWRDLAMKLGIQRDECTHLESDPPLSPTKQTIEFISNQNQNLTVEQLFGAIASLGREDVFKNLKLYFKAEDVDRIVNETKRKRQLEDN